MVAKRRPRSRATVYEASTVFRAPLPYVYRWCTDYSPRDPVLEKDTYHRRILSRTRREVIYEDLYTSGVGWWWSRNVVSLHPPDHWHDETIGNYRRWRLDYYLTELPNGRTRLDIRGVRWPMLLGGRNPPRSEEEAGLRSLWRNFAEALERDYRRRRPASNRPAGRARKR
jgi:hypothetical protein